MWRLFRKTNPFSQKEVTSFPNIKTVLKPTKIWSWFPMEPENKNDCAGEAR
jgi:hypothetical protein